MHRQRPAHRTRLVDIGQRAGCSHAAVSCVLTGSGEGKIRVGQQKAELIHQLATEMSFRPNYAARQLKGKRSMVLGLVSRNWETSFHLRTFYWLQQACAARGYHILAAQCKSAPEMVPAAIDGAGVELNRRKRGVRRSRQKVVFPVLVQARERSNL